MGKMGLLWIGTVAILLLHSLPGALCWGKDGHYIVCKIAEGYLSEDASAATKMLLPDIAEGDLANVCSWADEIRFHYYWSRALHFVDTPDYRCNYDYCRDCHDSTKLQRENRCVTGAIYNYTLQLSTYNMSSTESKYNLTEALMFLAHFVGDVHQPLHVGFIGDLGGNKIDVRWYRRKTNLHHVWDAEIIESAVKEVYDKDRSLMIKAIERNLSDSWANDISEWENCVRDQTACPNPYASESVDLACKYAYRNATPGITLEDDYFFSRLPIVEKRLAQGAIRLAATLNRIFASKPSISAA